jgi:hypothetical protein
MSHFLDEREFANVRTTCYLKGVIGLQHMQGDAQLSRQAPSIPAWNSISCRMLVYRGTSLFRYYLAEALQIEQTLLPAQDECVSSRVYAVGQTREKVRGKCFAFQL